ncbi:multidrug ABC transporter ATPase [Rothia sp. CCM 9419]|uniref:multidrug ABC transporter ATPase n=1 Tax=Rothia sp. CCM 9419 TaxID=3402662 RepID=UPI003AEEFC4F
MAHKGKNMLIVDNIWAKGRHNALFGRTSFTLNRGEVIIIQADSQLERTALSLTLTGRMRPSGGTILWTDPQKPSREESSMKKLRRRSELIDSPNINEPENHMRVRDYVSEMLSYTMGPFTRPRSGKWLKEHGLEDLDNLWNEQVTGEQNIRLMTTLAANYQHADLLVFDTPSRHLNHTRMWLPYLLQLAENEERPRAVVAVVPHISSTWDGKQAVVGSAHDELLNEENVKTHEEQDSRPETNSSNEEKEYDLPQENPDTATESEQR